MAVTDVPDADTRGRLRIGDRAVRRLAEAAAAEEAGRPAQPGGLEGVTSTSLPHASVKIVGRHVRITIEVAASDGRALPDLARAVRDHVGQRVGEFTGLTVDAVHVHVDRVEGPPATSAEYVPPPAKPPARPGLARTAGVILSILLILAGAMGVYDVLAGLGVVDGEPLTVQFIDWLQGLQPQAWLIPVGVVAALLGLWLMYAALRPRPRRSLPLTSDTGVYVTRGALEALVGESVVQHPGVIGADAKARRRVIRLTVRTDGTAGIDDELRALAGEQISLVDGRYTVSVKSKVEKGQP